MRVLHLTRDFPPHSNGGISIAAGRLVAASAREGLACAVLSFDSWRPRAGQGARLAPGMEGTGSSPVLRLRSEADWPAGLAFGLDFAPDVLHVHHAMLWEFARQIQNARNVPAVKTIHLVQHKLNQLRGLARDTLSSLAQRQVLAEADWLIAPSRAAAGAVRQAHPDAASRISVIPFGIDDSEQALRAVAHRARHPGGPVLVAGRFGDVKGTRELFDLMPRVLQQRPDVRFILAGGLPENPRGERRWLRRLWSSLSAEQTERVCFLGWQSAEQMEEIYARASILVVPGWFETFGLTALEGMLVGLAVVATRCGGPEELIDHGQSGLLTPVGDPAALESALCSLFDRPDLIARLGAAAAREARTRFAWRDSVKRHRELYASL